MSIYWMTVVIPVIIYRNEKFEQKFVNLLQNESFKDKGTVEIIIICYLYFLHCYILPAGNLVALFTQHDV